MLTIHGIPVSVHTRKVIIVANEKELGFRSEPVVPFQPPPGWTDLSPTGKIPVAIDGETILRDSSAICAYLERMHPRPALYPADPSAFAHALFLEEYADTTVFPDLVRPLFFQKVIRPRLLEQATDEQEIERVMRDVLPTVFGYLEREAQREFLAGDSFSIADIALMSNLLNFHYLGLQIDGRFPRLQQYFQRHSGRSSIRKALAGERDAARSMLLETAGLAA